MRLDGPLYPPGVRVRIQALLDAGDREGALLAFYREVVAMPEREVAAMRNDPVWPARLSVAHTIPRELGDEDYILDPLRFKDLNVPTLLLSGGDSPDFLKAATAAVHAALPNSRIAVMPGQQHIAMRTAPELFVRLVTEFLTQQGMTSNSTVIG